MIKYSNIGKIGLKNNGNTCYLNASLQLLTHSGEFILKLYKYYKNNKNITLIEKELLLLIIKKWFSNEIIHNPLNIQIELSKKNSIFKPEFCEQNDASELLCCLIEEFQPLFKNIFISKFNSILICKKCNYRKERIEDFNILSLDVTNHLNESFKNFFKKETLDDKVNCEKCNKKQIFDKKFEINKLSNNIIIHLKRFNNKLEKNKQKIHANNILTLNNINYELRGTIVHNGSFQYGHYFFLGKNLSNQWFNYNDSVIYKLKLDEILSNGYIFYYERIVN